MGRDIVYFDLETQRTANDAGGWARKSEMRMSLGVTYSTKHCKYQIFREQRVNELVNQLMRADLVVGFNILNFDYEVLAGYTVLDLKSQIPTLDMMADIEAKLGHRLGLDAIAQASLRIGKTGDGMDAIRWWREGKLMEIAEYCCFDVKVTKLVHEFGCRNGEVLYEDRFRRQKRVSVEWLP